mmetsp:Transcript_38424/g.44034  ORF Transcript_38424/g.44034 Transcript_38424/m.44034 type:complete len:119 (-) Transcript_38424:1916-2272(-)
MIRLEFILKRKKGRLPIIKLQVLTLRNNKIGTLGAETIGSFMKSNNTIKYLDLSFNQFDDNACESISEMLRTNQCLRYLNMLGNVFESRGMLALTNSLEHHFNEDNSPLMILKLGIIC